MVLTRTEWYELAADAGMQAKLTQRQGMADDAVQTIQAVCC